MSDRDAEASVDFGCANAVRTLHAKRLGDSDQSPVLQSAAATSGAKPAPIPAGVLAERKRALCAGHA